MLVSALLHPPSPQNPSTTQIVKQLDFKKSEAQSLKENHRIYIRYNSSRDNLVYH